MKSDVEHLNGANPEGDSDMIMAKLVVTGIAVLMLAVSAGIFRKQAAARACTAHNRYAGVLAATIGWGLLIVSLGLVVSCWAFS